MRSCRPFSAPRRTPNLSFYGLRRPPHRQPLRRALPDHPEARLGRDGERLPRLRPGARPPRRDQDPRRPTRPRRPVRRAVPPRGAERRRALASEHRLDLRPGRGRGDVLHRDGVRRGADAEGAARRARPVAARDRDRLHAPDPLGAAVRAPERDRAPRHQAAQRDRRRRGPRQGDGLRDRARRRRQPDDRGRLDHRHRAVPLTRAGARRPGRPDLGSLLDRDRPLRAAHRRRPVQRRDPGRDRDEAPLAGSRPALVPPPRDPARPRLRRAARAREGSRRPLPLRRGDGLRSRADRARDRRLRRDGRGGDDGALAYRRGGDDDPSGGRGGCDDIYARPLLRVRRAAAAPCDLALAPRRADRRARARRRLVRLAGGAVAAQRREARRRTRRRRQRRAAGRPADPGGGPEGSRRTHRQRRRPRRPGLRTGSAAGRPDRARQLRHDHGLDGPARRWSCPMSSAATATTRSRS